MLRPEHQCEHGEQNEREELAKFAGTRTGHQRTLLSTENNSWAVRKDSLVSDQAVEPKRMVEKEHAAKAGEDEAQRLTAVGRRFLQAGAENLRHVPPEGVAECGTEGVGDEIIDITGAVGEQLGAFDE